MKRGDESDKLFRQVLLALRPCLMCLAYETEFFISKQLVFVYILVESICLLMSNSLMVSCYIWCRMLDFSSRVQYSLIQCQEVPSRMLDALIQCQEVSSRMEDALM